MQATDEREAVRNWRQQLWYALILCIAGVALNVLGSKIPGILGVPLYLDNIGTVIVATIGGYLPGVAMGYVSNLVNVAATDPGTAYYCIVTVLIAAACTWLQRKGFFDRWYRLPVVILVLAALGGGLGSILTWFLYGYGMGEGISAPYARMLYETGRLPLFWAQFFSDFFLDLIDKAVTVLISVVLMRFIPESIRRRCRMDGWRQTPLSEEERDAASRSYSRGASLRTKILTLIAAITLFIALVTTAICFYLYHNSTLAEHKQMGRTVAKLVASQIDGDRIDAFLTEGKTASGYREEETELESIRNASEEIEYVYVYRILEDGCHVVFDIDTEDAEGASPGTVMPFDEAFAPYIAQLLAGEEIDVVISDGTYGWLLTAYAPVRDSRGVTQAYAAVDINMQRVRRNEISYIAKVVALFFGFFILILAIGLWLAEYNLLLPINTMALAAGELAATISDGRTDGTARMEHLGIHTGDEIEHLYESFTRTMRDTVRYIADAQAKSETISQMQNGLILVLADMVESRDKCTGDHVRKTAAYTRIIMEQMQRNGDYADQVTDAFIEDVANSAPLHDVGKIRVSDTILNKPGKLTDEEFAQMKKHTVYGREVIEQAIAIVPDSGYLKEAQNLATYHHEKWNGKGYPYGLAGEEIPLSARIMAVADVFDALVSRRSYKEPYSFEKACDIIREESGTHFDPVVAAAFLQNEAGARQVYETHYEHSAQAEPEMKDTGKQERPGE